MLYADYNYYIDEYYGTLSRNSFDSLNVRASKEIDRNVNIKLNKENINNLTEEAQEQLQYTACALIDLLSKKQESDNKKISSYSIDGVSKTFKLLSNDEFKRERKNILSNLPIELTKYL